MKSLLAGTIPLVRLILRRDRIRLTAWVLGIVLFVVAFLPVLETMFGTPDAGIMLLMENPAMVSMLGPMFGTSFAAMYAAFMFVMTGILAGLMNILLITRHTRKDEEQGRLEVIRSLPIGRLSNLNAALVVAAIANLAVVLGIGFGMPLFGIEGITLGGSLLAGASIGGVGMVFAAVTAIFCQLSSNTRTASSFSFLILTGAYMQRAMGDVSAEILSITSPLGLITQTQVFYADYWWPILVLCFMAVACIFIAFYFAKRRDLGQGIFAAKAGRAFAKRSLSSPQGLALRLTKTSLWLWAILLFVLGAMYGVVMEQAEYFLGGMPEVAAMFEALGSGTLTENFIGMISFMMVLIATIPVLMLMMRVRGEEKSGYTEQVLARSVSRNSLFGAYFKIALFASLMFPFVASFGMWAAMAGTMQYPPNLGAHLMITLNYLPAVWIMLGLSALLVGYLPKKAGLTYAYLFFSFFVIYIGGMAGFPEAVMMISPFGMVPSMPTEDFSIVIFAGLAAVGAVLMVLGFVGHRKRDMLTS